MISRTMMSSIRIWRMRSCKRLTVLASLMLASRLPRPMFTKRLSNGSSKKWPKSLPMPIMKRKRREERRMAARIWTS